LKLVPSGPQFILDFVIVNFPHKTESLDAHKNYLMSILELESYCPDIRTGIWNLIIEKLIQIDVIILDINDLD
jgi:RNA polymerase I-specific transcription initiation factor RRN3